MDKEKAEEIAFTEKEQAELNESPNPPAKLGRLEEAEAGVRK